MMSWWEITLIVVGSFILLNLIIMMVLPPHIIFYNTVYRSPRKPRVRECTNKKDEDQIKMFQEGIQWANSYNDKRISLEITNEGLNLKGEYINFGSNKCAIILQGRTESLLYSYYFAKPYAEEGYNILVVDLRAHGLSGGKYQTGGVKEGKDLAAWIKYIEKRFNIESFVFHGICIGGATAIYATLNLDESTQNKIQKIVCEGLFATYFEMFKLNFAVYKKKPFPMLYLTFILARIYTGVDFFKNRPINVISKIKCPILLIYSEEDNFSPKESCENLYKACLNPLSKLVFFPHGRHSHVRSLNTESYDEEIKTFLNN